MVGVHGGGMQVSRVGGMRFSRVGQFASEQGGGMCFSRAWGAGCSAGWRHDALAGQEACGWGQACGGAYGTRGKEVGMWMGCWGREGARTRGMGDGARGWVHGKCGLSAGGARG